MLYWFYLRTSNAFINKVIVIVIIAMLFEELRIAKSTVRNKPVEHDY